MNSNELLKTICTGLLVFIMWLALLFMHIRAIVKKEYLFHGGIIRGKLAQIIGVTGTIGISAGVYLAICLLVFHIEPPGTFVAISLFAFFIIMALSIRFFSIFSITSSKFKRHEVREDRKR